MLLLHRCVAFAIVVLAFGGCRLVWIYFTRLLSLLKFSMSLHYLLSLTCRQLCPYAMVKGLCRTSVYNNQQAEWWSWLNCLVSIFTADHQFDSTVVVYRSTNVFCLSFTLHKEKLFRSQSMLSLLTEGCRRRKFPLRHPLGDDQQNHHSCILPLDLLLPSHRCSSLLVVMAHGLAGE